MVKIVFIPSNSTHVKMFLPVFDFFKKNGGCVLSAICLDYYKNENSEKILTNTKINFVRLEKFRTKNAVQILRCEKPDLILVGNDSAPIEKSFIVAAKYLGIPSLLLQDGLIIESSFSLRSSLRIMLYFKEPAKWVKMYLFLLFTETIASGNPAKSFINIVKDFLKRSVYTYTYGLSGCTKIAVAGDYTKRVFERKGIDPQRIVVTGQPRFDGLVSKKNRQLPSSKLNHKHVIKTLLLCTQPFVEYKFWTKEQRQIFLLSIINAVEKIVSARLVIKLHPVESFSDYKNILSQFRTNNEVILQKNCNLYSLIELSDIVLTATSTVALEALIMNKNVLIVDCFKEFGHLPYVTSHAAAVGYDSKSIEESINKILYDPDLQRTLSRHRSMFVYNNAYKIDGKASLRVANLILQILKDRTVKK